MSSSGGASTPNRSSSHSSRPIKRPGRSIPKLGRRRRRPSFTRPSSRWRSRSSLPPRRTKIFRQGSTRGTENKHWFSAKFLQQFRLFFRYSEDKKAIVLAWVNDDRTNRAYGSKPDAYAVFKKMLDAGDLPGS
ncbi:type II toxin-antitoxin system YhaV family toxin [Microvirga aerilata]|uniref:type II toxin-antitoxin system YhaV family toxin n=1 Tax=Microvirga aerilata TaxID=670292 RepID=UPI0028A870E5|nr:type II toxin-antitoxin system YhaV family toxin [Microvirga aerilata]